MTFKDRTEAGRLLAEQLENYRGMPVVVLALPRGGVPVAAPIAKALGAPLDLLIVQKIGAPGDPEYAIGAVAEAGEPFLRPVANGVDQDWLKLEIEAQRNEARRRRMAYLGSRDLVAIQGKTVLLVDDGLATGATMRAAIHNLRQRQPLRIVVAVPVASSDAAKRMRAEADAFVPLEIPAFFGNVGRYYSDFEPVEDGDVVRWLS